MSGLSRFFLKLTTRHRHSSPDTADTRRQTRRTLVARHGGHSSPDTADTRRHTRRTLVARHGGHSSPDTADTRRQTRRTLVARHGRHSLPDTADTADTRTVIWTLANASLTGHQVPMFTESILCLLGIDFLIFKRL